MIKTNLKKDSEKHNCSNDIHVCRVHMHENKKKKNKLLRNLLCNLLRNPLNLTWPRTKDSQNLLRDHLCNLLRNPLNLTWLCTKASQTFSGTFSGILLNLTWLCTKASQTSGTFSGTLLNLTWLCTKASQAFSGTFFFGTLLSLTWLCTKASWNLLRNILRNPVLALHQGFPEPSSEPCWTWPGSAPKPPRHSPELSPDPVEPDLGLPGLLRNFLQNLLRNPVEPNLALHQGFLEASPEHLTWLCTKASWNLLRNLLRNPVEPDLALRQSLPDILRNLLRNPVEPDLALHQSLHNPVEPDLALHQSLPDLLRNLRNVLRNLVEPDPASAWVHTGAILGWRPH